MTAFALESSWCFVIRRQNSFGILEVTGTTIRRQALIHTLIMARTTIGDPVRSLERETGQVVVELRLGPEVLQVTLSATRQLTVVIIVFDVTRETFLTRSA